MIKFFRKIRQKMLVENRVSRYFLYAIGEIFLVVIGILIALSINNTNAADKLQHKEIVLLREMSQNLEADLMNLEGNLEGEIIRIQANEMVVKALRERLPLSDSLKQHYGNVLGNFQLVENTAAWENLKSVGLDLISNDSLRSAVARLYSTRYQYLENLERGLDDRFQWDQLYPQILEHLNMDTMWVSASPVDHEALLDDREFREVLKMNIFFRKYMQGQYSRVADEVRLILIQLNDHIQTLEDQS